MRNLDLRQLGMIVGLPIYLDVSSIENFTEKGEILSERDRKVLLVQGILKRAFEMSEPTDEEVERFIKADD